MELILRAGVGKPQYLFRLHLPLHAIKSVPFSRIIERWFNLETLFASSYSSYSSVWKKMSLHELASPKTVYFFILPAGDANMAVMMSTVWLYGKRAPTSSSRKPLKKRLNKHRTAPLSLVCQVSCATIRSSSSQTQTRPNPRVTCHRGQMDQSLLMSSWAELMLMQHEMLQPGVPNVQLRARCGKLHAHGARLNDYILMCLFRCIVPDRDVWETIDNARTCDHAHIYDNVTKIIFFKDSNFSGLGVCCTIKTLPSDFWSWKALRSQDLFAKHTESVLSKTSKIRSLIADLQKNYNQDSTAMKLLVLILYSSQLHENFGSFKMHFKDSMCPDPMPPVQHCPSKLACPRAVETLNNDLKVLDSEYNKLSEHLAKGERDDHSKEQLCLHIFFMSMYLHS